MASDYVLKSFLNKEERDELLRKENWICVIIVRVLYYNLGNMKVSVVYDKVASRMHLFELKIDNDLKCFGAMISDYSYCSKYIAVKTLFEYFDNVVEAGDIEGVNLFVKLSYKGSEIDLQFKEF